MNTSSAGLLRGIARSFLGSSTRRSLRRALDRSRHLGWRHHCPLCRSYLRGFLAHGFHRRENAVCPICQSRERHRLACLYLEEHAELFVDGGTILHVSPEVEMERFFRGHARWFYVSGTYGPGAMVHLDAQRLPFGSATVDFLYCSHVLNMVPDDNAAMAEFARVLSPRGRALIQVPVLGSGTLDLTTGDPEERQRLFGDRKILRRYGSDLAVRLQQAGLSVCVDSFARHLPAESRVRYGVLPEDLYLCAPAAGAA